MTQEKVIPQLAGQLGFIILNPQIHGEYKGYWYTITPLASSEHIIFAIDFGAGGKEAALRGYLNSIRKRYRFSYKLRGTNVVFVDMKVGITTKGTVQKVVRLLEDFASAFPALELHRACYNCNTQGKHATYSVGTIAAEVCPSCVPLLEKMYAEEGTRVGVGSYATGAVGAVLGALTGSALWLVLFSFGLVTSYAAIAIAHAASYGYGLFRGKLGKRMPAILFSAFFFAILAANLTEIACRLYAAGIAPSLKEGLLMAPAAFFNWKIPFIGEIWVHLGIGLLLGLLTVSTLISLRMDLMSPRHYEVTKL